MEDGCVGACARSGSGRRVPAVELRLPSVSGRARRLAALPFVHNASPDIRAQIESFPPLHPNGVRDSPLQAVLLTDGELDHTLGLLLLREAGDLEVHATAAVHETLCKGTSLLQTLGAYASVEWRPVATGTEISLADGLSYRAFQVPTNKRARFGTGEGEETVVGYRITDGHTG